MFKKTVTLLITAALGASLIACNGAQTQTAETSSSASSEEVTLETEDAPEDNSEEDVSASAEADATEETEAGLSAEESGTEDATEDTTDNSTDSSKDSTANVTEIGVVANDLAEDEDALIATYTDSFEQLTYTDEETGLSITYNLYLPEGYDESSEYPMVVFIGDSSCAGTDATYSLSQGRGALVWASDEWQSVYETIVAVPTYPETILDDHGSYTTTEYVELTERFIEYMTEEYSVDTNRIYGTGQSMGCMTTLILASEYPDLFAACMFVDGQWDISLLEGLEGQTFVYFAAEDDTNAWNGMQEVMNMFEEDGVDYTYSQWDGTWSVDELSEAATELYGNNNTNAYFISWESGTIEPKTSTGGSGMGGAMSGEFSGPPSSESGEAGEAMSGEFAGPPTSESGEAGEEMSGEFAGPPSSESGEAGEEMAAGSTNSSAYHMASFDYAYNCVAVMEWLFQQSK